MASEGDGVLVTLDTHEQAAKQRCECESEEGYSGRGDGGPEEESVELPEPELAGESDRVFAGGVKELGCGEWEPGGVEDAACNMDKGDDQDDLKGIHEVVPELRGCDIEPEEKGQGEAEDGGAAEDGVYTDEEADGDAPG